MIIQAYVVYDSRRTLYDFGEKGKLVALILHRFYVLKLAHPLLYDDDTLTYAANDIKRIFLIVGSKALLVDGRSWSYLDIELCTISTHKRNNHYTQIDDTSFVAAMPFGGSTLIFGSKYDR